MKLRTQFSFFSAFLVILSVTGVSTFLYYTERKVLLKEMEEKEKAAVQQLVQIGKEALLVKDDLLLLNYVKLIKTTIPAVIYAFIENTQGKILAHTDPIQIEKMDSTPGMEKALKAEDIETQTFLCSVINSESAGEIRESAGKREMAIIDFAGPVYLGKDKVAVARVGFSRDKLQEVVSQSLSRTKLRIYGVAFVSVLIGLLVAFFMARTMTHPIQTLSAGSAEIGKGNFDYRIELMRSDELGQLARTFNKMAEQLKQLDEMKKDFISSVTHELRSPLAAIESYINMMLKQLKDGENPAAAWGVGEDLEERVEFDWKDNFLRVKKNTIRLGRFINDLLDVAKIEAGKLDVKPVNMDYSSVIKDIVELFIPKADEQKIKLSYEIEDNIPFVYGDEDRLKQVVTNLIGNALKFTPEGGEIKINVRTAKNKNIIETSVADTGYGIPPDKIDRIFSKFEQVTSHRDMVKGAKGTGLGLTIAKAIVEMHGGAIWVESVVNKGTTFFFTLPAV